MDKSPSEHEQNSVPLSYGPGPNDTYSWQRFHYLLIFHPEIKEYVTSVNCSTTFCIRYPLYRWLRLSDGVQATISCLVLKFLSHSASKKESVMDTGQVQNTVYIYCNYCSLLFCLTGSNVCNTFSPVIIRSRSQGTSKRCSQHFFSNLYIWRY